MSMRTLSRSGIVLIVSSATSWMGAALDHGDWFGTTSTIFGLVGLGLGYWLARELDDYINL